MTRRHIVVALISRLSSSASAREHHNPISTQPYREALMFPRSGMTMPSETEITATLSRRCNLPGITPAGALVVMHRAAARIRPSTFSGFLN